MTADITRVPSFRSLLFQLKDIKLLVGQGGWNCEIEQLDTHVMLIFKSGAGSLYIDERYYPAAPEHSYLLTPGQALQINSIADSSLVCYKLEFAVIHSLNGQHGQYVGSIVPRHNELKVYPLSRLLRLADQLYAGGLAGGEVEWLKQNFLFHELMVFVLEQNLHMEEVPSSTQSVNDTILYLQRRYMENITVTRLAQLANVPTWKYTAIFKEFTGKKPLEYLTELRINRSKEWLQHAKTPLREVAQRVGFTDEYYFNRRFRQATGMTPRQYSLTMLEKVRVRDWTGHDVSIPVRPKRIIYFGDAMGDFLKLGIQPIGGNASCFHNALYEEPARHIQDIGFPLNPAKASALEPDLIISSSSDELQYEQLSRIAPTLTYNSWGALEERMRTLGEWFGKREEAEKWLLDYQRNTEKMWKRLRPDIRSEETASVFVYHRGRRLFVMGTVGLASILYHPSGFRPTGRIQSLLNKGRPYQEITETTLSEYAGNRIFMMKPHNPVSRQAMEELKESPLWKSLPAVQQGHAYLVDEQIWNIGDAFSRERLLDMLPLLLSPIS
jgi:ABC-type Fe3+-hydroxamate transport system substrate-binding protein